jgi:signal transduction histidine kinase
MTETQTDPVRKLCHEISGPLTSILVQCDLLLQRSAPNSSKAWEDLLERIASIQEEALRISQHLRTASR